MATVKHIQVNTLPDVLEPGAIYFVRSTGQIVQTDLNGVPVTYPNNLSHKHVKVQSIIVGYTDANKKYPRVTELSPLSFDTQYAEFRVHCFDNGIYSRAIFVLTEPSEVTRILFKNAGRRGAAIDYNLVDRSLKEGKVYGYIGDIYAIPTARRYPIPNPDLLYEGIFPKVTAANLYTLDVIHLVRTGKKYNAIVLDYYKQWNGGEGRSTEINKFILINDYI